MSIICKSVDKRGRLDTSTHVVHFVYFPKHTIQVSLMDHTLVIHGKHVLSIQRWRIHIVLSWFLEAFSHIMITLDLKWSEPFFILPTNGSFLSWPGSRLILDGNPDELLKYIDCFGSLFCQDVCFVLDYSFIVNLDAFWTCVYFWFDKDLWLEQWMAWLYIDRWLLNSLKTVGFNLFRILSFFHDII